MLKTKSSGDCLPGFPNKKCQLCKEPCDELFIYSLGSIMFVIYIVSKKNNVFHFPLGAYVKVKSSDSKDDPHHIWFQLVEQILRTRFFKFYIIRNFHGS